MINENIEITVISVNGKAVKLGFNFPPEVSVLRKEVMERIELENRAAAKTAPDLSALRLTTPPPPPPPQPSDPEDSEL